MAEQEIVFKTRVDTGNTANDINNINEELKDLGKTAKGVDNIEKAFIDLNDKVENGGLTIRQLTKAVKDYATIAVQAGEDSPIGQEAIRKAGELKDRLGDLQTQINANANDGRNMQTALQVGSLVTAGYGAVQGAMALMGSENENLTKTLVKLQAVQAVLAGLEEVRALLEKESLVMLKAKSIWTKVVTAGEYVYATAVGTSTGALRVMRIAMLALPIVAITAGIVAIAAAMGAFGSSTDDAIEKQNKFNAGQKRSAEILENVIDKSEAKRNKRSGGLDDLNRELELLQASGATRAEIHKQEIKILEEQQQNLRIRVASVDQSNKHEVRIAWKAYEENKKIIHEKKVLEAKYQKESEEIEETAREERLKKSKDSKAKTLEAEAEANRKRLELSRLTEDLMIANIEDSNVRQLEQLRVKHEREDSEMIAKFGTDTELLKQLHIQQDNELKALNKQITDEELTATTEAEEKKRNLKNTNDKALLEAELLKIQTSFEAEQNLKKQLALLERDQELQNKELTDGEKLKIEQEYQAKIRDIDKETSDKEIENRKVVTEQSFKIASDSLSSIQSLSDIVFSIKSNKLKKGSKEEEEAAKKQFEINKQLQIATAVINGAQAVTAILSVPDFTLGVASAARIASAGLATVATVAKIASTKFGGGGGGSVPPPSAPPSTFNQQGQQAGSGNNPNGGTETNTLNATNNATGIKVSVVDSEIKAIMDASAQVNVVSTIGG